MQLTDMSKMQRVMFASKDYHAYVVYHIDATSELAPCPLRTAVVASAANVCTQNQIYALPS